MQTMWGMLHRHITQQSLQQMHTHSHITVKQEDTNTHIYNYTKTQGEQRCQPCPILNQIKAN